MEQITTIASAIATEVLPQVFKEPEKLPKQEATEKINELIIVIQEKIANLNMVGILEQLRNQPTEEVHQNIFQQLLENQMRQDEEFAKQVKELAEQIKSLSSSEQTMLSGIEVEENIEAEDMTQKSSPSKKNSKQEMATNLKAKNIKLGNLNQES